MFVLGEKVKAGLLGQYPSLAPADLFEGDLKYNVDFRSVGSHYYSKYYYYYRQYRYHAQDTNKEPRPAA